MLKYKKTSGWSWKYFTQNIKTTKIWLLVLIALIITGYLTFGNYGFYRGAQLFIEQRKLKNSIALATARKDSLLLLKEKIITDEGFMEKMAREKLGMIKKNETLYIFIDPSDKKK